MRNANNTAPVVAVVNGAEDIVETMKEVLEDEGFNVVGMLISEIKRGRADLVEFMRVHNPLVVVYDVPPPYEESMTFLKLLKDTRALEDRCILLTTTNKRALLQVTGTKAEVEILGKPFDLAQLVKAVKAKVRACERAA